MPLAPSMEVGALRHAAVFMNPGSYFTKAESSSTSLLWPSAARRISPSWTGTPYWRAVRLSVDLLLLFSTRPWPGNGLAHVGAIAEAAPSEMDTDFEPSGGLLDKLASAIDESRARVSQDLILYRTQRPVKRLADRIAVIVDGAVIYPWKVLAAAKAAEQLSAKEVVIATPVATPAAAERIAARQYSVRGPTRVLHPGAHPAPYGDVAGDTPPPLPPPPSAP